MATKSKSIWFWKLKRKEYVKSNLSYYTSGLIVVAALFGSMYYEYYNTREKQVIVNTLLDTVISDFSWSD